MRYVRRSVIVVLGVVGAALGLHGCTISTPFKGPGYSKSGGAALPGLGETVVVGLTYAELDPKSRGAFDDHTRRVVKVIEESDGLVGFSVRRELLGKKVWTMSVWRDGEALDAFVRSPTHREAMRQGMPAVKATKFARLNWPKASVPPTWEQVERHLESVEARVY